MTTLGILGGGQLGRMLAMAAARLGIDSMRAPAVKSSTGAPGTLLVTRSIPFNMAPKMPVLTDVGNCVSARASGWTISRAGSAR